MRVTVCQGNTVRQVDAGASDSLHALLNGAGFKLSPSCSGKEDCNRCRVIVRDESGVSYCLACDTHPADGIEIFLEECGNLPISNFGSVAKWNCDDEGWGYGIALDVGTTMLVCRLYDLETGKMVGSIGTVNPQIVFGADDLSRIKVCNEGGVRQLSRQLGDELVEMVGELVHGANLTFSDVTSVYIAGNTVMENIAVGLEPSIASAAGFEPKSLFGTEVDYLCLAREDIAAGSAFFVPCISDSVGGDTICGLVSVGIMDSPKKTLFLDLGTNCKIAFGNESGVTVCAPPIGPVFEGGTIKYGLPACTGAISSVRFEDGVLVYDVIGDVVPVGLCGTALVDIVALMINHGLLDDEGRIATEKPEGASGLSRYLQAEGSQKVLRVTDKISVTQSDVDNLLSSARLVHAGVLALLNSCQCSQSDVDRFFFAGGLGHYLNIDNAVTVGLIPPELSSIASSIGNTSIEGVSALLLSDEANESMDRVFAGCEYLDLSKDDFFANLCDK